MTLLQKVTLFVLALIGQSLAALDLTALPQNTARYVGNDVVLSCWVEDAFSGHRVQWYEFAYSEAGSLISDGDFIAPAHPQAARYALNRTDPRSFELVIRDLRMADSGTYLCVDSAAPVSEKQRHSAELIVFGGPQNCTTTIPQPPMATLEGTYYSTECEISYGRSSYRPSMLWEGPPPFGQGQSITDTLGWNGMSFIAARMMNTQYWTSTTFFAPLPAPPTDVADNIPDFRDEYDTDRIIVNWPPRDMYAEPVKPLNNYEVGDVIECFADAFPIADFEWHNTRTNERFNNNVFVVPQTWLGTTQLMRCVATNTINNLIYVTEHILQVNVPAPTTPEPTTTPVPTTTPPAVSQCFDLTGHWESNNPDLAHVCLEVDDNGNVHGVLRQGYNTFWYDLIGQTNVDGFDHTSWTAIWPLNRGVTTFIGECSRCFGEEILIVNAVSRSKGGPPCGTPGAITYTEQYEFRRSRGLNCPPITLPTI